MGMCAAYVKAAKGNIPLTETKIVHDRFHVITLATEAVAKVRHGGHRKLSIEGDKRLLRTRFLWIRSEGNLSQQQRERFDTAV